MSSTNTYMAEVYYTDFINTTVSIDDGHIDNKQFEVEVTTLHNAEYVLRKYAYPVIIFMGILGNTMSAYIFSSVQLRKYSCNMFLTMRSICDNGMLINLLVVWLDFMQIRFFHKNVICQVTVFLSYICSFLSVWCVVCVTIDNYIRMCRPSSVEVYCKKKYATIIISMIVVLSLCIYHIPLWTTHVTKYGNDYYCLPIQTFHEVLYVLTYIDTALTFVIPLSSILFCMALLIFEAMRSHQRSLQLRERFNARTWPSSTSHYLKVTKLLFAVSVIFLILHTPTHVIKIKTVVEAFSGNPQQPSKILKTLDYIFQVMYCLNFSVNFIVYYVFGKNFRTMCQSYFFSVSRCLREKKISINSDIVPSADVLSTEICERDSIM